MVLQNIHISTLWWCSLFIDGLGSSQGYVLVKCSWESFLILLYEYV